MGLEAMDRAMAWIERTGVRPLEAEVWRMRGELLLMSERPDSTEANAQCSHPVRSRVDEAEACFRDALAVASLVRLRQQQGAALAAELAEARLRLREVYTRFTEGFAFPDLREAAALIGE
jgi:hypothetical protein